MSGRLEELKNKGKFQIPKVVAVAYGGGRLRELFITKLKSQFMQSGFQRELVAYESGHKYSLLANTFEQTKQTGELPERFFTWAKRNAKENKI